MAEVKSADVVVIVTNHKIYDYPAILRAAKSDRGYPECAGRIRKKQSESDEIVGIHR